MNEGFTAAEQCAERLARESEAERYARDDRDLTLGEQVIRNPMIRDLSIQDLNPFKLSELQSILGLREFYKLLPDVDLKECYFEGAWGFQKYDFVLANWREMSVERMKWKVKGAHPWFGGGRYVYPPDKVDVDTLETKEDIARMFWELTYVPQRVYRTAVGGAHVLRLVKAGDVGEDPDVVKYLLWACRAGLDLHVIHGLAEKCEEDSFEIQRAAKQAAKGGHTDVFDLLASEFEAWGDGEDCLYKRAMWGLEWPIRVDCFTEAAEWGQDAMIDHLVEEYGMDQNGVDEYGETALHRAAQSGRARTVKHLVEKHNVDINKRNAEGRTALDLAEEYSFTECADYLRALQSTRPPPS